MASRLAPAGVPVKLLHEAEGHTITVELKGGELYRGNLEAAEDTMNLTLSKVFLTGRDGRQTRLEHVYLRGSHVRFLVLPDILKNAPIFKKVAEFAAAKAKPLVTAGRGRGRGRGGRGASRGGAGRGGAGAGGGAR